MPSPGPGTRSTTPAPEARVPGPSRHLAVHVPRWGPCARRHGPPADSDGGSRPVGEPGRPRSPTPDADLCGLRRPRGPRHPATAETPATGDTPAAHDTLRPPTPPRPPTQTCLGEPQPVDSRGPRLSRSGLCRRHPRRPPPTPRDTPSDTLVPPSLEARSEPSRPPVIHRAVRRRGPCPHGCPPVPRATTRIFARRPQPSTPRPQALWTTLV